MGERPIDHPVAPPAPGEPLGPPDVVRGGPQVIPRPSDWSEGAPAPWAHLPDSARHPSLAAIRATVVGTGTDLVLPGNPAHERSSAVLAAIYEDRGEPQILLTRRSWDLRTHRGEVSFPGGRVEPFDADMRAAALREAHEEVGLAPELVEIVGRLDPLATMSSGSLIVPFIGVLPHRPLLRPDPREVAEIRDVPIAELLADGVYREEIWRREGTERAIWFFELEGDTVWGATASMLRQLLCRITGVQAAPSPGH
ncbi:MAG: CoA pyrophosphatase [Acidimicrobiia bacterium]|nr:CoA pyrophosphatase [Acidimicrobiia bacterium]